MKETLILLETRHDSCQQTSDGAFKGLWYIMEQRGCCSRDQTAKMINPCSDRERNTRTSNADKIVVINMKTLDLNLTNAANRHAGSRWNRAA